MKTTTRISGLSTSVNVLAATSFRFRKHRQMVLFNVISSKLHIPLDPVVEAVDLLLYRQQ